MCGIVAYIGKKEAFPILIKGLKRLEYRGYDSAGIALLNGSLHVYKKAGKVSELEEFTDGEDVSATMGIGHTRWATHGVPNDTNAHPHVSNSGNITLIHNGIIENYASIKAELTRRGYTFYSDTDTEVLVNLVEEVQKKGGPYAGRGRARSAERSSGRLRHRSDGCARAGYARGRPQGQPLW